MGAETEDHLELNRDLWDKRVRAHLDARLYPSEQVEDGSYRVSDLDVDEVGEVHGRRLLHLQCNAGADTLFWARRGASVVGVDFSREAITEAQRLAQVTELSAQFICADIYDLPKHDVGTFDIVYTSMGVLWWLPDLDAWARLIASHLHDGGIFYIHEIHPFAMTLRDDDTGTPVVKMDYFGSPEPELFESTGTYYEADDDFASEPATECGWVHPLADVVTSLCRGGLRIEHLHEHPYTNFRMLPSLVQNEDGLWVRPDDQPRLPLTFSLLARRQR